MSRLLPSLAGLVLVASLPVQPTTAGARDPDDCPSAEDAGQQRGPAPGKPALPPEPGPFQRLVNQRNFVGPGILPAVDPSGDGGLHVPSKLRLPADFQPSEAILLVGGRLAREFPKLLADVLAATRDRISVVSLISTAGERNTVVRALAAAGLPPEHVRFVEVPTDTIWVRDFGPIFLRRTDGTTIALDVEYQKAGRKKDNHAAVPLARYFKTTTLYAPILLEGGDLLGNGRGLCVTTTAAVNRNISRGYDRPTIAKYFRNYLGSGPFVLLEPLRGETTGHVDVFACFTDSRTIVVGAYQKSVDPVNAALLDRNAALLAKVRTAGGRLRVVRVPMPNNQDDLWRTYTNGLFANGLLLLPCYPRADPAAQRKAFETFRSLLPGWDVVGIDAGKLIAREGALRCITIHVPREHTSPKPGK